MPLRLVFTIIATLLCLGMTAARAADSDALLRLSFDEGSGTTASDSSGAGNNGKLVGGPVFRSQTADGSAHALNFDGTDDYVDLGSFDVAGSGLTMAAWFKADSFPGQYQDPRIISKASGTAANDHVFMLGTIKSGSDTVLRARVRVNGATTTLVASSGKLKTGVWQHAAATYDGSTLRLYLNGVEVGRQRLSGKIDVDPNLKVAVGSQPGGRTRFFDGMLDDVQVLKRAKSPAEILAMTVPPAPEAVAFAPMSDSVMHLAFDEGSGASASDSSGAGNNGKLVGGPVFRSQTADGSAYALSFDGTDDYVDLGSFDVAGSGLTMAAWFKADSFPGKYQDPRIISKAAGTAANDHVFMLGTIKSGSDTVLRARVRVNGATTTLVASSGKLRTGVWQHAAATYDGSSLRLYLNGVEVGRQRLSGKIDVDPNLKVAVGSQPGGRTRFFDGMLDDVQVLKRAISPSELQALSTINNKQELVADTSVNSQTAVPAPAPATTQPVDTNESVSVTEPVVAKETTTTTEQKATETGTATETAPVTETVTVTAPAQVTAPALKSVKLRWQLPLDRADGSFLALSEISGFEIYYSGENSAKSEAIRIDGNQTDNYVIQDLPADVYHISMVTIDNKDVPSELSEIVSVDLR